MQRIFPLLAVLALAACQTDETGPARGALSPSGLRREENGPPSTYPFGPDTYRFSGPFTGVPTQPLSCAPNQSGPATYDGELVSTVDQTVLDARLELPTGSGPFPLVTLIHGYAGSKSGSGDIADKLLADGYAVLRYSTRGFGESWGQVNLADLNLEIADMRSMIGRVVDDQNCRIDPNHVAITGASYGGGHSWLSLVQPVFQSPLGATVHIVAVAPIAPARPSGACRR